MSKVKEGDKVKVHYTGKLEDGTVFDTSENKPPFEFEVGGGQVIPGFEKGVVGMEVGDKKTIKVEPDEAYGPVRNELIAQVNRSDFPEHITPEVGQQLQLTQPDNSVVNVTVTELTDEKATLDANHPLAGKPLSFDVELVEVS